MYSLEDVDWQVGFAERYRRLLHAQRGAFQDPDGSYRARLSINLDNICEHLRGDKALGLTCAIDGNALLMGMDIDADFGPHLGSIRDVLTDFGLDRASFVTTGSSAVRGKVITCLAAPVALDVVTRAADTIRRYSQLESDLGPHVTSTDVSAYPIGGEGGILRVLGRNPKRSGPLELPLRLDDLEISDLWEVVPVSSAALDQVIERFSPPTVATTGTNADPAANLHFGRLHRWAVLEIQKSWMWGPTGTLEIMNRVVALAFEFKGAFGIIGGERRFRIALEQIGRNSPALNMPSPKNRRRRNPLTWDRIGKHAWRYACEYQYLRSRAAANAPTRILDLYEALISYVHRVRIRPYAFNMTYSRIAELIAKTPQTAWRLVHDAASMGLIVIHDPGKSRARDEKISTVKLGLVGFYDTPDSIRAKAKGHRSNPTWDSVASRRQVGSSLNLTGNTHRG